MEEVGSETSNISVQNVRMQSIEFSSRTETLQLERTEAIEM